MAIKAMAVLEFSEPKILRSCPLDELELEPVKGSRFLYKGNLYQVAEMPIVCVGATASGSRKTFNMQLAEVLALVHGESPVAIGLFQSLRSIADGNLEEQRSLGGLILPSAKPQVEESTDRLVYIQLTLVKARPSTSLIELLGGGQSTSPAPDGDGKAAA